MIQKENKKNRKMFIVADLVSLKQPIAASSNNNPLCAKLCQSLPEVTEDNMDFLPIIYSFAEHMVDVK